MTASPAELTYFIEVASALNLSRASERLGISQPSLSAAIKRLETSVGTELLIRHKRGVSLTQAGRQLLAHSKQLIQYWDEVKTQTLASHQEVQGHFIIGCHPSVVLHKGPGFLRELLVSYPKLEVEFQHDISRKITERVINLSIDIGICVNPVRHPDLIIQKLMDDEVSFWQSTRVKNTNQQLSSGNGVIIFDGELSQVQSLLKRLPKKGISHYRTITSHNLEVIAALTAEGCGVGILPGSVGESEFGKYIKPIPKMPVYHDEICLVYRHENRGIKAMQVIMSAIKAFFKK